MWLCVYTRRGMAKRTSSMGAGCSAPSALYVPNITEPISTRADAGQLVQLAHQRLTRILVRRNVRVQLLRVDVHGVAADRAASAERPARAASCPRNVVLLMR